jgi:abhydrolase domain-containing protein 17
VSPRGAIAYHPPVNDRRRAWIKRWVIGEISIRRFLRSVAFLYGSLCLMACLLPDHVLYQPHPAVYVDSPAILKLRTASGPRISARFDPVAGARFAVIMSHGNAEDLDDVRWWFVQRWNALGVSVLTYDYEGFGTSEGKPSERRLYEDIDAAYEHLTGALGVPPERVILYGRSLGGGPTVDLASRRPVAGVVLESTFMSAFRVVTRVRLLPWDQFDNLAKIPRVESPLLVLHGTEDRLIPLAHGRALFDAAPGPKRSLWVEGSGHADLPFVAGDRYEAAIRELLALIP